MPPRNQKIIQWAILIGGALFVLAMFYGAGMRRQLTALRAMNEERKVAEQDYREAQRDLRLRLALAYQLEGRRQVALAVSELEKRNFGVAGERLAAAVSDLKIAQDANTNAPDLSEIQPRLAAVNLTATDNIESQRAALSEIAGQMDVILNNFVPEFLKGKLAEDAAHPIKKTTMNDVPLPPGNEVGRRSKE